MLTVLNISILSKIPKDFSVEKEKFLFSTMLLQDIKKTNVLLCWLEVLFCVVETQHNENNRKTSK